jgi:hypothetical protein
MASIRATESADTPTNETRGHPIAEAVRGDYLTAAEIGSQTIRFRVRYFQMMSFRQRDGTIAQKPTFTGTVGDEDRILVLNRTALLKLLDAGFNTFEELEGHTFVLGTQRTAYGPGIVIVEIVPPSK